MVLAASGGGIVEIATPVAPEDVAVLLGTLALEEVPEEEVQVAVVVKPGAEAAASQRVFHALVGRDVGERSVGTLPEELVVVPGPCPVPPPVEMKRSIRPSPLKSPNAGVCRSLVLFRGKRSRRNRVTSSVKTPGQPFR